ncbi:lycopene cyclase domain-containing protein [Cellulomonas sp. KRMCY2]|uniref:lycopene cyclase domain-containing protein n=1 Tax=Cellulomonas sp. KRMCY2 TaxID=1304865 RepID=UPI00045E961A|nr:lycopene cyclase domain-containing protein [Cellulomonas sp. KRMCY2]
MSAAYGLALLVSLAGMAMLDRRFRLFFFDAPRRAAVVLVSGVAFFVVWDLVGVDLGIFFRGRTEFMSGWLLAPQLPVEEIGFLALLCYLTMNLYVAFTRLTVRDRERAAPRPGGHG